jgi:cell division protease FtsH
MFLGGRSAEELVFDEVTTGAQDDIERASRVARSMVTEWGMSDALGPRAVGGPDAAVGRDAADHGDVLASLIDDEVRTLIDDAHHRARAVLVANRSTLDRLAATLIERESLDEDELNEVFGDAADPGPPPVAAPVAPLEPAAPEQRQRIPVGASALVSARPRLRDRVAAWRRGRNVPEGLA